MAEKKIEPVEVECPKCHHTEIVYIPQEDIPKCPDCRIAMHIKEVLVEGKAN